MSNTALRVYEESEFTALSANSESALAMRENTDGDSFSEADLIRVKTPTGGGLFWTVDGVSGPENCEAIEGVIVFKAKKGLIWPSDSDDATAKEKPCVVSNDLKYGKLNVPRKEVPSEMMEILDQNEVEGQPGVYDWENLPWTQWNTGKKGVGKYAKEHILLFILRKNETLPLFIQVGAGSVGDIRKFFIRMQNVPYYRAVVSLKLKQAESAGGKTYSKIVPTMIGTLTPEQGEIVKTIYRDRLQASHEAGKISIDKETEG